MTAIGVEVVLSPEQLLTVLVGGTARANVTTSTAETHQRGLRLASILLRQVRALKGGVASCRGELLELELVHLGGDKGEDEEGGES